MIARTRESLQILHGIVSFVITLAYVAAMGFILSTTSSIVDVLLFLRFRKKPG